MKKEILILSLMLLIGGCTEMISNTQVASDGVIDFETCSEAGNPIMESYPRQCRTDDGTVYIEKLDGSPVGDSFICSPDEKKINACTEYHDPVCGDNDITYNNACLACVSGEIDSYEEGACPMRCTDEEKERKTCTREYVPVCGSDGTTYSNACTACFAGVASYVPKECEVRTPPGKADDFHVCTEEEKSAERCTLEYMPVCGDDGLTYSNGCSACSQGADSYLFGECGRIDMVVHVCTEKEKSSVICTMEYAPVCGDNGQTYGNGCSACASDGIDAYSVGACGREIPVGVDFDEHGCNLPTGWAWDEQVGACTHDWELGENQALAAKLAVDEVGREYGLSVYSVDTDSSCEGCFTVHLKSDSDQTDVVIAGWEPMG